MDKKTIILNILKNLKDDAPHVNWLIYIIDKKWVNDNKLDKIIMLLSSLEGSTICESKKSFLRENINKINSLKEE